ncbi:Phage P22-like portal protein [uncultured Caudovirales phage]|uniref:Phage P22-like portal protein n=1 Tax=uncultured Caudovirales phage TaxID=2100421 RepID=A0A6J5PAH9_9CAUD|nr:Phage P22-like portal protein [uncultured Caudovirales phage]
MMTKSDKLNAIHSEALRLFDNIQSAVRGERLQCLQDRRFYSIAGAQWEGALGEQFENKPRFEVNKVHLAVIRIINEYRNNRITVDFVSKEGGEYDDLADTCDGLYRADEQDSGAEEAYDNAFEEAVGGGFGAWRLRTAYEDEEDDENEQQRIKIEPIFDADSSVFFDLDAKRQDKSDAKHCFVISSMSMDYYKEEWGDDPASWTKEIHQSEFDWLAPDVVYIAEFYKVEEVKETVHIWQMLGGEEKRYKDADFQEDDTLEERLLAIGAKEVRQKPIKRKRVRKYILSGGKVLEDCGYIAGKFIPIVPVYGKRWFVDNVERCMGHVRLAKDAQRLKNTQLSKLGEISALSSVEKPILTPEQIAGHSQMWADDNIKNWPYLLVNPIMDLQGNIMPAGPVAYTRPPQIPQALAALMQITDQDMRDLLGNQQMGEEIQANTSGIAVDLVQNRLDMQTFIYMSNMAKAVKRSGEIWLSMAKDVLVEEGRKMKSIGAQGEKSVIELSRRMVDKDGEIKMENDLSEAEFDIAVSVGPTSASKRASTVRALTSMTAITDDPETKQVLGAMAMMNMEGEGITEVRDYFRKKLLRMGVVKPTEEEAKAMAEEMQNAKPDPNTQYLQAAAEEASANATQARAKTILTMSQAEKTKAETVEIISNVDASEQAQALEVIDRLAPNVQ